MLAEALKILFPASVPARDWLVRDDSDGRGPYIASWSLPDPQPTQAQIDAAMLQVPAARQRAADLRVLAEAAKDTIVILTELIPVLIQKGHIASSDFSAATRQSYQDLKAIADRVKVAG